MGTVSLAKTDEVIWLESAVRNRSITADAVHINCLVVSGNKLSGNARCCWTEGTLLRYTTWLACFELPPPFLMKRSLGGAERPMDRAYSSAGSSLTLKTFLFGARKTERKYAVMPRCALSCKPDDAFHMRIPLSRSDADAMDVACEVESLLTCMILGGETCR